ncbi:hypothetical protein GJ496_008589 [Pomphorhynchus laevis]|nr:hypothetical protein GJ496_008589 [Pomphorhynchus laevis]
MEFRGCKIFLHETRILQARILQARYKERLLGMKNSRVEEVGNFKELVSSFSRLVKDGQTSRACRLLNCDTTVEGIHSTSDIVGGKSVLSIIEPHPTSSNAAERVLLKSPIVKDQCRITQ